MMSKENKLFTINVTYALTNVLQGKPLNSLYWNVKDAAKFHPDNIYYILISMIPKKNPY